MAFCSAGVVNFVSLFEFLVVVLLGGYGVLLLWLCGLVVDSFFLSSIEFCRVGCFLGLTSVNWLLFPFDKDYYYYYYLKLKLIIWRS